MNLEARIKYPKTPHVPWSTGTSDDKTLDNDDHFIGEEVVVTLKMDGENTSIYTDYIHARSLYPPKHPSQTWVKKLAGEIGWKIPEGRRICGENLYAKHTVPYDDLKSYFMVFSIWQNKKCFNWNYTKFGCVMLGLITVPVIYEGVYDKEAIIESFSTYKESNEGYVIRNVKEFEYDQFDKNVAKYVNPGFRQALKENNVHWASAPVVPNKLKVDE